MTNITINFRNVAIGLAAIGLTLGAAFGAGIAYGRTDDGGTTATTPNIADIIASRGGATGGGATGFPAQLGSQGTVAAINGDTITITTAQGSTEVHVNDSTTTSLLQPASLADLTLGSVIIITGEERDDGSIDATAIDEVPPQYQALAGGAGQGGGNIPGSGTGTGPAGSSGAPGFGGASGGAPGAGGAALPTATLETAPVGTPSPTPLTDRTDCEEIRGTDYRSATEREFFLENCIEGP